MWSVPLQFDHLEVLGLLLLAVPVILLGLRNKAMPEVKTRWAAIVLRLIMLALLVCMLAGIQTVRRHDDQTVVVVVDQSDSMRHFAQPPAADPSESPRSIDEWITQWIDESANGRGADDRLGVVTFDGQPTVRHLPSVAQARDATGLVDPVQGTDVGSAIRLAMALFTADSGKRLVVVSDGNDTVSGDGASLLAVARQARLAEIPIDVLPIDYQVNHEVMVASLHAPSDARQGQAVALRVVLRATDPVDGQLNLRHNGQWVDLDTESERRWLPINAGHWASSYPDGQSLAVKQAATGDPPVDHSYLWVHRIELPLLRSGPNRFEVIFEPASRSETGGDTVAINNRAQAFTFVHGKTRLLWVGKTLAEDFEILPNVLRDHDMDVDRTTPYSMPSHLSLLQDYDAVILHNVPAEQFALKQQDMLVRYVNDLGGGLIMIGGPDAFGAGGWTGSPVDRILPVHCQVPSQTSLPSGALVLVLDRSGSMDVSVMGSPYTKQRIANEAAILAMETLYEQDMVGVIAFDSRPQWVVPLQRHSNIPRVAEKVRKITPGGGTDIHSALELAIQSLEKADTDKAAVKHVVLLTDGQSKRAQYHDLIGKMMTARITLSTIGVGDDVNSQLLARLAQSTGGTYYGVSEPTLLPQVFIKEARTIRKNLVQEFSFQPQLVQTGSPTTAAMDQLPPLDGFVRTGRRPARQVFTPILGPEGQPIFAHWQVGLGRAAAFTSDATNRWATPWLRWPGYADFWSRVMRTIARPTAVGDHELMVWIQGEDLHLRLDVAGIDPSAASASVTRRTDRPVAGIVLRPDDTTTSLALKSTAPGVYEAAVPATKAGPYVVNLLVRRQGHDRPRRIVASAIRRAGDELRSLRSNRGLLEQMAHLSGGRVLTPHEPSILFFRDRRVAWRSVAPIWHLLGLILLALFLIDVATRRLAWDVRGLWLWLHSQLQLFSRRDEKAVATLAKLKRRASQVTESRSSRDDVTAKSTGAYVQEPNQQVADKRSSSRRIVPHADITSPKEVNQNAGDEAPTDDTTRRLLHAKRRASGDGESNQ